MICSTHHALLPLQLLEQLPEFCEKIKQMCFPNPYWWRISNILCRVSLKAGSSDSVSFSISGSFWALDCDFVLQYKQYEEVRNSFVHSKLTLHTSFSFHPDPIKLLLKIQHIFKLDCYTGMTLTIASAHLCNTSHTF